MTDEVKILNEIIKKSRKIVIFSGAGVSTESGIPDYRSTGGLYSKNTGNIPPETILSHTFFEENTKEFYEFYKNRMMYPDAKPNPSHLKAAELERKGKLSAVVTQNIDGLYFDAGCKKVYELHGSVHRNTCMRCGKKFGAEFVKNSESVPVCSCGGTVKPDVVLYEEALDGDVIKGAVKAISKADCLIVMGTSLTVYPASGFINYFDGDELVLINKAETAADGNASLIIRDNAGEIMSQIVY